MSIRASVVLPVYNGERTLADCLSALQTQSLSPSELEVIVVDDGSTDGSAAITERFGVRVLKQTNRGAAAARNAGMEAARGKWVAFTDADCVPSRLWLVALLDAVDRVGEPPALGAAGPIVGYQSSSAAARFVDLSGGLDAQRHLSHPHFPFAPTGNLMYRREALLSVGGFDPRYRAYDACDLHTRLRRTDRGTFAFEPRAVVLHRHRSTWADYWRQQVWYGRGYGQFLVRYRDEVAWSVGRELRAWGEVAVLAAAACKPGSHTDVLLRRGRFVKTLAQRLGFVTTYWNPRERARW